MTQRTANHQLKKLIDETGLPYDGVARAVRAVASESGQPLGTNRSAVHHWTQGAVPDEATPDTWPRRSPAAWAAGSPAKTSDSVPPSAAKMKASG
ncbi:hypothetical protein [Streptomyces sp. NPDC001415]